MRSQKGAREAPPGGALGAPGAPCGVPRGAPARSKRGGFRRGVRGGAKALYSKDHNNRTPPLTFRTYQILPHTNSYFHCLYSYLDLRQ